MERIMNAHVFEFRDETFHALPSGALFWPSERLLVVSDLHIGKAERAARRGGPMLPPYEGIDTLMRLSGDIAATAPKTVVCLGDSFDDAAAAHALDEVTAAQLKPLKAARARIRIEGNHDPGPLGLGGTHLATLHVGAILFRHIAEPGAEGEVSGHYHPKARLKTRARSITRRCFLLDGNRMVLPAYGTYTGGLFCDAPELAGLMAKDATAILLGTPPIAVPMPRRSATDRPSRDCQGSSG
jgi:DNA ligase-associated metallophosphoesterase